MIGSSGHLIPEQKGNGKMERQPCLYRLPDSLFQWRHRLWSATKASIASGSNTGNWDNCDWIPRILAYGELDKKYRQNPIHAGHTKRF
jgi:hypothetical protein